MSKSVKFRENELIFVSCTSFFRFSVSYVSVRWMSIITFLNGANKAACARHLVVFSKYVFLFFHFSIKKLR